MENEKRVLLEVHGWRVGSPEEFLGLSADDTAHIELRLKLSEAVRKLRKQKHPTQA